MGSIYRNDCGIQRDKPETPVGPGDHKTANSRGNGLYSAGTRFADSWSAAFTPLMKPLN